MAKPSARASMTETVLVAVLVLLAVLARYAGRREITIDMRTFFAWYADLTEAGVWHGLGEEIGNYNAPFLYLLALTSVLPGAMVLKVKLVWVAFDFLLVFFVYRLVAVRWPGRRIPMLAALLAGLLPTVVINASFWGQTDSMWTSFALGGVYCLLRERPWWGVALCAVALALKPQGIFIFPLLLLLVLAGRIRWRQLLAAPAVYLALDLPALLAGRDPMELLTVYDPGRQAIHVPGLTSNAPSVFVFFPVDVRVDSLKAVGYALAAALIIGLCYVLVARRVEFTPARIVLAAATFSILVPYTVPGMHERYFYLADVLTLVLAFYRPRLWYVPVLVQTASLLSYGPYLFGRDAPLMPPMVLGTVMLAALLVTGHTLVREAVTAPVEEEASPPAAPRHPDAI
ncbi:glycosyltransferase 87 family protein [Actinoplanes sp. NPDC049265]|uniref:glycosyltransferase 87 family protein n=1 Tax=Actinoplanes sp. NPDC049265 TaxID=3363902 RepID=UPI003724A2C5